MWGVRLRRVCSGGATQAGKALGLFERNVTVSRVNKALDLNVKRDFHAKSQGKNLQSHFKVEPIVRAYSGVPKHKPTPLQKKILLWAGRFKKEEDIPETVSFEMIEAAKNRVRVKVCYIMIALAVVGCIAMVISGKRAVGKNETLTGWNLQKRARLKEEAQKEQAERSN